MIGLGIPYVLDAVVRDNPQRSRKVCLDTLEVADPCWVVFQDSNVQNHYE